MSSRNIHPFRVHARRGAAIVFVHGGGGSARSWASFPNLLAEEPRLADWDIFNTEYPSHLFQLYPGWWNEDPLLPELAEWLGTTAGERPLAQYESLAFIAHSLGGLIVQRAMVDHDRLAERVGHFIQFGVSSLGFNRIFLHRFMKQLRMIAPHSSFLRDLRARWNSKFGKSPESFRFLTVAGDRDMWVPPESSLKPFGIDCRKVIPGGHLEIVRPESRDDMAVQLVVDALTEGAAPWGPRSAARVAVEKREFRATIRRLAPGADTLDDDGLVTLALALEGIGRRADAVKLLTRRRPDALDPLGVYAGRLKRNWWLTSSKPDAQRALSLYCDGLIMAVRRKIWSQAHYHAINVAFLHLTYRKNKRDARRLAERALRYCARAERTVWRPATEGEANLYLGRTDDAIAAYREALTLDPKPRQVESIREQAMLVAECLGDHKAIKELRKIFP